MSKLGFKITYHLRNHDRHKNSPNRTVCVDTYKIMSANIQYPPVSPVRSETALKFERFYEYMMWLVSYFVIYYMTHVYDSFIVACE